MRFLHTADLHLNCLRAKFPGKYLIRHKFTLNKITAIANRYKAEAIVISGDIWDRPDLTNSERLLFSGWLHSCPIPVIAISGNHDQRVSHKFGDTALNYLSHLPIGKHVICDGLPDFVEINDVVFLLLPFHGWSGYDFDIVVKSMVEKIRTRSNKPIIAVMHEAVTGAVTDNGTKVIKSNQIKIPHVPDIVYWALGDIHKRQKISDNAYYPGSPHQVNFGEDENKGVLIVDTGKAKPKFVRINHPYPLVVWDEFKGDDLPEFLKLKPQKELDPNVVLPDNIIYEPPVKVHGKYESSFEDPLMHLHEFLEKENLQQDMIIMAEKIARKMLIEVNE